MKKTIWPLLLTLAGCYMLVDVPPVTVGVSVPVGVRWETIPGTTISYSADLGTDIFFYSGRYYCVVDGVWYISSRWRGPWSVIRVVPDAFLWIPSFHPAYRIVSWHPRYHVYHPPVRVLPSVPYKGKKGEDEREGGGPGSPGGGTWIRR